MEDFWPYRLGAAINAATISGLVFAMARATSHSTGMVTLVARPLWDPIFLEGERLIGTG